MNGDCPACDGPLAPGARSCRCGWVAEEIAKPQIVIQSHIENSVDEAKKRLNAEAHAYCLANGLARNEGESMEAWTKRMRLWAREKASRVGRRAA